MTSSESSLKLGALAYSNHVIGMKKNSGQPPSPLIDDETQFYISLIFIIILSPAVSLFGFVTNIINMLVFRRQRLKDSMTVSLFALAFSESGQALWTFLWGMSFIGSQFYAQDRTVDYDALFFLAAHVTKFFRTSSILLTVYICAVRCLCVMWPLKFKYTFTVHQTVSIIMSLSMFVLICGIPKYTTILVFPQFDPVVNTSRLKLWRPQTGVQDITLYIENLVIGVGSQFVVFILTFLTVLGLQNSMKFRKSLTQTRQSTDVNSSKNIKKESRNAPSHSSKDARLSRMIVVLAIVFFVLRLPDVGTTLYNRINNDVALNREFRNIFLTLGITMYLSAAINASVSIFIYYRMSTDFRMTLRSMISFKVLKVSAQRE